MLEEDSFDPTSITEENIKSTLNIGDDNYQDIVVENIDNTITVTIVGKNKWDGLVATGSYNKMNVYYSSDSTTLENIVMRLGRVDIPLTPSFSKSKFSYTATVRGANSIILSATATEPPNCSITVNEVAVQSGFASPVPVTGGQNIIIIKVTSNVNGLTNAYEINLDVT